MESAQARRDQQIARAQFEADLQAATLQSQAAADRAALQAAQAMADARSAHVEVPRLHATVLQLQVELRAMQVASQQAQERALRLESELSAAQDRIGAAERKAAHAEKRHSALQKRMDDWDAFDPDLHAALNASLTPPATGDQMQPEGTVHPAGSETTVQSAQQVHTQGQADQLFSREQLQATLFGQSAPQVHGQGQTQATISQRSVHAGTSQFSGIPQGIPMFPPVHQAQTSAQQQMPSPSAGNNGDAVDSTASSDVTFRPVGAGGSSSGPNGGGTPPPFPSYAGSHQQQRQGQAFIVQVKPKDPLVFRGRVEDDVTTWTAKVQDFFYLTDAGDVQQVAYAATLLQEAAADWWHALLRTRGGMRPLNFAKFADLLGR